MTRGGFFGVIALVLVLFGGTIVAGSAEAGQPQPWQLGFQVAASPTMEGVRSLHDQILMPIITAITIFVLGLILFVAWRFRASRNPTPSRTVHNTTIEVIWTVIPVMILVVIAIPSFRLLYMADRLPPDDIELTLKAVGHQWFWSYEYPDQGFTFEAYMVPDQDLQDGQPRLLATDNAVVLPVGTNIQFLTTASDVLHSWAMPAFGVKLDSAPPKAAAGKDLVYKLTRVDFDGRVFSNNKPGAMRFTAKYGAKKTTTATEVRTRSGSLR
jgi:cytochrome c oxidase subunit 2